MHLSLRCIKYRSDAPIYRYTQYKTDAPFSRCTLQNLMHPITDTLSTKPIHLSHDALYKTDASIYRCIHVLTRTQMLLNLTL